VHADDNEPILVLLRPRANIRKRPQPVDARVGPEVDEDDLPLQLGRGQARRIEPFGGAIERRPLARRVAVRLGGLLDALAVATVPLSMIVFLIVFFILGFFSYATIFAGVGALASKAEDVQGSNGPLVFPIIMAYMLSIFALQDPDKPLFVWASLVPLISPMLMFTRVATSTVPAWQIGASIGLSILFIWVATLLAAKLYRVGVLMYGKSLSPKEILRALRAPS